MFWEQNWGPGYLSLSFIIHKVWWPQICNLQNSKRYFISNENNIYRCNHTFKMPLKEQTTWIGSWWTVRKKQLSKLLSDLGSQRSLVIGNKVIYLSPTDGIFIKHTEERACNSAQWSSKGTYCVGSKMCMSGKRPQGTLRRAGLRSGRWSPSSWDNCLC